MWIGHEGQMLKLSLHVETRIRQRGLKLEWIEATVSAPGKVAPDKMLDIDAAGQMVGIEVLSVSLRAAGAYGLATKKAAA